MAGDETLSGLHEPGRFDRDSSRDHLRATIADLAASNFRLTSYLRDLFESTEIAAVFLDRELRLERYTPAAADVLPLDPGDQGRRLAEVAPSLGLIDLVADAREVIANLDPRERQAWVPDRRRWYLVRTLPYRTATGAVAGAVVVFVDISALKRGQEHAAQLAAVVTSSQDAIHSQTLDMVITAWNAGAARLYQYSETEALGRRTEDLIVPPERKGELGPCYQRIAAGEQVAPFDTVRMARDGQRLHVLLTLSTLRDADGTITGVSAIAHDITERKVAEERHRLLAEELAAADRRKDEFLAMLAHELRNPLAPIRHAAQILGKPGADADTVARVRSILERQVQHLSRLVDDLLDVARLVRGQIDLRRERVNLAGVIERALETAQPEIAQRQHDLRVELPSAPLYVDGDLVRLAQVLGNLIHNAAKYTPARGHITISATRRGGEAIVTVKDTGVGIAPEMLPRIFALFEQAASSLDRAEGGLGIGLSLARRLAEAHGGSVSARSDGLGCGSEFELRLPAASPPLAAAPLSAAVVGPSRRILVVDDNPDVADTMAEVLRLDGHVVAVAADGLEALAAVDAFSPTVLLVDIGLPHLDGFELARRLRQRADGARLLLVAVTGYGQAADQRRCFEAGFDHHLTKPVALDILNRVLAAPRP